jgi:hypothetical protein
MTRKILEIVVAMLLFLVYYRRSSGNIFLGM